MKRLLIILSMIIVCVACESITPPTTAPGSNAQIQVPTTTPTREPAPTSAAAGGTTGESQVVSGDAQTPTQICQSHVPATTPSNRTFAGPEQVLQAGVDYRAVFCTGAGAIYVDLFEDLTPVTVNSFVFLSQQGYYNNTTFHRVIQDFMAQGGDPEGTGGGGPGYQFQEEIVPFLHYDRPGWLAMARTSQPGSNGSQFFITTVATSGLNYESDGIGYTIFGEVLEGQQNVSAIRLRDPNTDPAPGTSLDTVVIITDPATVTTTYVAPQPLSSQQVISALQALSSDPNIVQSSLVLSVSGALSGSEVVAAMPEVIRGDYTTYLDEHNFEYRVNARLDNPTCNLENASFMTMTYTIDSFASVEDAGAAFTDGFLNTVPGAMGLTGSSNPAGLGGTLYTGTTSACNRSATRGLTYYHYGRYIVTVEVTVPADGQNTPDVWITQFINMFFGRGLSEVFRAGLR